jgi:predicted acetyltransferase
MERAVKVLYEAGYHTSALWPFSYNYYRKFGWEIGSEHRMYSIPSDLAKTLGLPGSTRPAMREDLPSISRLVDRFAKGHNCVSVRDELWWSCISSTYGFKFDGNCDVRASRCPWVHETDGEIDGYCVFGLSGEGEQTFVDVKEIIADTSRARNAILSRLSQAGAPKINFCAPIDDGFLQELPNPRLVKTDIQAGFQFRVINPPGALELRSVDPSLEGRIGFHVIDPVLPAFGFDVEVSAGRISRAKGRASERLSMSVQTFSQLYTGYISPLRAAELGRIDATSGEAVIFADRLFPKRIPFRSFIEMG